MKGRRKLSLPQRRLLMKANRRRYVIVRGAEWRTVSALIAVGLMLTAHRFSAHNFKLGSDEWWRAYQITPTGRAALRQT